LYEVILCAEDRDDRARQGGARDVADVSFSVRPPGIVVSPPIALPVQNRDEEGQNNSNS
jgi:hypothetical protein